MNNITKALSGILVLVSYFPAMAKDNRPNIIFILADDLSAKTLGCAGDSLAQTPVIDNLARQGNRFSNAFVTTSISMASRASLFTGMYMCQHGVTDYQSPMPIEKTENVYPIRLKDAGYTTGFIGKFGFKIENNATAENWFDYYKPVDQLPVFKTQADGSEKHITATMGENAIEFLRLRDKKKPFCLSVSFHDVHAIDGDLKAGRAVYPYQKETEKLYVNTIFQSLHSATPRYLTAIQSLCENQKTAFGTCGDSIPPKNTRKTCGHTTA
jgi:arylsulfatase A-like enzyme